MSVVLRTIDAFPKGRSTEQLCILLGAGFDHAKRISVLNELDELTGAGRIVKGRDGLWRPTRTYVDAGVKLGADRGKVQANTDDHVLVAARAGFEIFTNSDSPHITDGPSSASVVPQALLRYWRSALRADPRGATTARDDLHGVDWHLVAGSGPVSPGDKNSVEISIELDGLSSDFRQALLRREGNENALAVGWPLAVGRHVGTPVVWPIGLLSGNWRRTETHLLIRVETDDVLVNPDWIQGAARDAGWSKNELRDVFTAEEGVGLKADDLLLRLREAASGQFKGRVTGETLGSQLNVTSQGIYDMMGLFLPSDSTFTAGASRDLDQLANWPSERLARTALATVLGITPDLEDVTVPAINLGTANREQLKAIAHACSAPLSVVTGPPGTGKSQTIVSIAASVLMQGGSVLVASKNHQALDAVKDRLGGIASDVPFLVRTLDPATDHDMSFKDVLKDLVSSALGNTNLPPDIEMLNTLAKLADQRGAVLGDLDKRAAIECEIADVLERIEARQRHPLTQMPTGSPVVEGPLISLPKKSLWNRMIGWFKISGLLPQAETETNSRPEPLQGLPLPVLNKLLAQLRQAKAGLNTEHDPIELSEEIEKLTRTLMPAVMADRVSLSEVQRLEVAQEKDDLDFQGQKALIPSALAQRVVRHRPLWLASVLGTPKRIPLDDGLFDLVIFDEASQCDIASALPLLARAKRAVVVGDNQQLSFIPQLGLERDRNLMQSQGLPISNMSRYAQSRQSLFDFALKVPDLPRVTLRQQFRSAGPIVEYISREFYENKLQVSQDPASQKVPNGGKPGLAWTNVPCPSVGEKGNVNSAERNAIVAEMVRLLEEQSYEGTIGVISPFRAQALEIDQSVRGRLNPSLLSKADFRAATVDGFQGQERDLILFSPCIGTSSAQTATIFVQKDSRRLNVAISRARAVAHVFGDLSFARSGKVSSLVRLAAFATEPRKPVGEGHFDSEWERRVYYALLDRGLKPKPQHEIAGRRLDFALFGENGVKMDLEVDGRRWHQTADGRRKSSDLWRDKQMEALGWRVRRFWVDELSQNMEACLDLVEQELA